MAATDCNLLFGLLALQNDLIDQDQLIDAFRAWTRDKARSMADHLVAGGELDADQRAAVEALAAAHLKKHGASVERSLAALAVGRSTRETLARVGDREVERLLEHVGSASTHPDEGDGDRTATYAVGTATSTGQRFRILRPHARGGLGAVFVALDTELHREVAVKQICDQHADDAVSRARFLLEAEITGGLEHPGIVPVYGLGTYSDGRPFYAMRFIRGDSLKEAIERFHARHDQPPLQRLKRSETHRVSAIAEAGGRWLELRKLLRRFTDVCNAIEYAHSRGVLHRDIKPANIVIGKHGETLVVDWGLAKARGRSDTADLSDEQPLLLRSASGNAETLPGSALGTPAYMSPEQAHGNLEHLGPRSDVYSLGATLYCLLTGIPPVKSDDVGAVLRAAQKGEFPQPRQLDASIDRALEAVCLTAMALKPEDRYATPKALAEDVERWMADEPVSAWPEPFTRRARRWARRNRTAVAAGSVALLALMVGLGAVTALQARANDDLRTANNEVNRVNSELADEKARVQERYDLAMDAIKTFHTGVSEDFLLKEEKFRDLRDQLLKSAADFYGKVGALLKGQSDLASRRALGDANFELAELTSKVGQKEAALAAHQQVLDFREAWMRDRGALAEDRAEVGRSLVAIGRLLEETGHHAEALETLARVRTLGPVGDVPVVADRSFHSVLATSLYWTGAALLDAGKLDEALKAYQEVQTIRRALLQADPDSIDSQRELSWCYNDTGRILHVRSRFPEAQYAYEEARRIKQALTEAHPGVAEYQRDLAISYNNLANALDAMRKPSEAMAAHERAQAILRKFTDKNPAVTLFQVSLATSYNNMGILLSRMGKSTQALKAYEKARAVRQHLADANPTVTEFQSDLARSHLAIGWLFYTSGQLDEARTAFDQAMPIFQRLAQANPVVPDFRASLANILINIGLVRTDSGDAPGATAVIERARETFERLAHDHPTVTRYASGLAESLWALGRAHRRAGHDTAAALTLRRSIALRESVADLDTEPRVLLACSRTLLASLAGLSGSRITAAEGTTQFDRATVDLRRAVADGYRDLAFLRTTTDLDPLRSRPDFQLLLMDLAMPSVPFTGDD
jgi:serine/threonine-protein kinase